MPTDVFLESYKEGKAKIISKRICHYFPLGLPLGQLSNASVCKVLILATDFPF